MNTSRPGGRILLVLFLGVLMAALDIAIVGPALPAIREHYALTERSISWVFNIFVLFNLLGLPLMSRLSDLAGRRKMYLISVGLFALGSIIVATGPPFVLVLIGRAVQGFGASGIFPVASAVVGDVIAPERRGRALGMLGAVFGLAFIIGPITAGILLRFGWQWLFLVSIPLAIFVSAYGYRVLPARRVLTKVRLDWPGIAFLGSALALLAYGMNQIDATRVFGSLLSVDVWPFLICAAALTGVFIKSERKAANPLLRLDLFRSRQVVIASLLGVGAGLTEAAFVFMPAMAVAVFGVSKSSASFMLLPLVFAVAIGSPIAGRLLDRIGSRALIVGSTTLLTIGLAVMGFIRLSPTVFNVASVLIGAGLSGLLGSSLSYILLHEAQEAERTVAQGVVTLAITIGQMTGAALIGAIVASAGAGTSGYTAAFKGIAVAALLLTLLSFRLKSRLAERVVAAEDASA